MKTTRGRGSNKISRTNLNRGIPQDSFVYARGAGIDWTELAGPMPYHLAYAWVQRLEKHNATGQPLYAATRITGGAH